MSGLGNYQVWQAPEGQCAAVDAADLGLTEGDTIASQFTPIPKDHPGYDPVCDCYCWGFKPMPQFTFTPKVDVTDLPRPEPVKIIGVGGLGARGPLGEGWKVCHPGFSSGQRCPCRNEPDPECPECPVCPTHPAGRKPTQFGVTMGLLAAGAIAGGLGYYAYKKWR